LNVDHSIRSMRQAVDVHRRAIEVHSTGLRMEYHSYQNTEKVSQGIKD